MAPAKAMTGNFPSPIMRTAIYFLSWGSVAVKAYASYKPELALKYVKNVLAQYAKDGLAFQRYGRVKQDGLGDDILSGNSLSVVGLYQAIYGINPLYNRFYLDPHITAELTGTQVKYNYRDQKLTIDLAMNQYAVSNDQFSIVSKTDFGFFTTGNKLLYFNGKDTDAALTVKTTPKTRLTLAIKEWNAGRMAWTQSVPDNRVGKFLYEIGQLTPNSYYTVFLNGKIVKRLKSVDGYLRFETASTKDPADITILNK